MVFSSALQVAIQMSKDLVQRLAEEGKTIQDIRDDYVSAMSPFSVSDDVKHELIDADGVRCEWITPPGVVEDNVIFYLHGGGYITCSVATHRDMIARIARAAGVRALGVDYRLAPEYPFPAALDDAVKSYQWLIANGFNPAKIVLAGDSAGGGLVLSTLVVLRDKCIPLPAAAVCMSPWVDFEAIGGTMITKSASDPSVSKDTLLLMAKLYLGNVDPRSPLVSPLYADLAGLPPLLIQVGDAETLLDDSRRIAERIILANGDVSLDVWEDMIHCWQFFAPILPEGQNAIDRAGKFIREHL